MERILDGLKAIAEETRLRLLAICDDREFTDSTFLRWATHDSINLETDDSARQTRGVLEFRSRTHEAERL